MFRILFVLAAMTMPYLARAATCDAGYYLSDYGICTICETGFYCADDVKNLCPFGTHSDTMGMTACKEIDAGYYGIDCFVGGYTQLEYIQSGGASWIDTEYIPNPQTSMQLGIYMFEQTGNIIIGNYGNGDDYKDYRLLNGWGGQIIWDYNASRINGGRLDAYTYYDMEIGNYYVKQNGELLLSGEKQSTNEAIPIGIFASQDFQSISRGRIFYLRIYENGILVRNFVPSRRDNDGQIGMYEIMQHKFYSSENQNFISGPVVNNVTGCRNQQLCETGYYCKNSLKKICPTGTYNGTTGATQCAMVEGGNYSTNCAPYTMLEYINLKSALNTRYVPTIKTAFKFGGIMTGITGNVLVGYIGNMGEATDYRLFNWNGKIYWDFNSSRIEGGTWSVGTYYDIEVGNNYVKQNDELVLSGTEQSYVLAPSAIILHSGKIYYLKIYEDGVLVRDFVPVRRETDGVLGLYDRIGSDFYMPNDMNCVAGTDAKDAIVGCTDTVLCEAGYYCTGGYRDGCGVGEWADVGAGECSICTNGPENSYYTTPIWANAQCPWLCNDGFGLTSINTCAPMCDAGITKLNTSTGVVAPLFATANTSPALHIKNDKGTCHADLIPGTGQNAIHIRYDGQVYHTMNINK